MPSLGLWGYFLTTAYWVVSTAVNRHQVCLVSAPSHEVCSVLLTPDTHSTCNISSTMPF
jgi:hypothetical protein